MNTPRDTVIPKNVIILAECDTVFSVSANTSVTLDVPRELRSQVSKTG